MITSSFHQDWWHSFMMMLILTETLLLHTHTHPLPQIFGRRSRFVPRGGPFNCLAHIRSHTLTSALRQAQTALLISQHDIFLSFLLPWQFSAPIPAPKKWWVVNVVFIIFFRSVSCFAMCFGVCMKERERERGFDILPASFWPLTCLNCFLCRLRVYDKFGLI